MDQITSYFAQQGVLGIMVIMLIGVIIWQQKRNDNLSRQVDELQNKRIADTNNFTNGYTEISKEMVAAGKDTVNTLNLLQRSVDTMLGSLQNLLQKKS